MRLIDADNYKGKVIASHCYSGVNKLIRIDDVPTVDVNNLLTEELEKFKADILNLGFTGWADKPKIDRKEVLTILNKYISELSGDNKQIRCNSCQNNTEELSGECYECVKGIQDWYEPIFDKNKSRL